MRTIDELPFRMSEDARTRLSRETCWVVSFFRCAIYLQPTPNQLFFLPFFVFFVIFKSRRSGSLRTSFGRCKRVRAVRNCRCSFCGFDGGG